MLISTAYAQGTGFLDSQALVQFLPLLTKERNRGLEDTVDPGGLLAREAQVLLKLSVAPPGESE